MTGRKFGDEGDLIRFMNESEIMDAESVKFLNYIRNNRNKLALGPNDKTIMSIDLSTTCRNRKGARGP